MTPTFDDNRFTWDLPGLKFDADYVAPDTFTPDPHRTVVVSGQSAKRAEFAKDPDARLDYTLDWTKWLVSGDMIASGEITTPSTVTVEAMSPTTSKITFWARGGAGIPESTPVAVRCRITTAQGRIDDRTIYLRIQEL